MHTSYAQNFEDILLFRALGHVKRGFYVDVGANHPDKDSVTKLFYEIGWSGVNIEPSKKFFRMLKRKRPNDINVNCAVSSESGELKFYEVPDSGLSSLDESAANRASKFGLSHQSYSIPVTTLNSVFAQYCGGKTVAFLKIDVEGWEKQVIEGFDLKKWRPIVILVEAIHPDTQEPAWVEWENLLIEADYNFVWFDGINRFYLRDEDIDLKRWFNSPPNVLDEFYLSPDHPLIKKGKFSALKLTLRRVLPPSVYQLLKRIRKSFNE